MANIKNKRENHFTKRPKSGAAYGESKGTIEMRTNARGKMETRIKPGSGKSEGRKPDADVKKNRSEKSDAAKGKGADQENHEHTNVIVGRNPVIEALKAGREVDKLFVASREGSMIKIIAIAKEQGIPVMHVEKAALDRISDGQAHQGVAAYISPYNYSSMEDIYKKAEKKGEEPFILILDGLEDPHNLGAVMRTAECAGAHGVIIPKRHSCGLTETVAKSSAGAIEYMPVVKVTNIAQTVDELKAKGIWVAACDMGGKEYYSQDMTGAIAVVIGSEGFGISKLVKDKCDFTVSMPMLGAITSLNASNAAAVVMYEVRRQRNIKAGI